MNQGDPPLWRDQKPLFSSKTTTIAVLSDVHGNIRALNAVLDALAAQHVDAIVCNGDLITSSAHAAAVVQRIQEAGIPCTQGNHERYLCELDDPQHPKWQQANWAPTLYDYATLEEQQRTWLQQLPDTLLVCDGDAPLLLSHGAPGHDTARVTAQNDENAWRALFSPLPKGCTLVGSHLHWYWQHKWQGYQFVRTPATGLPLDGDQRAGFVLLHRRNGGWLAEQCRIPYDIEGELAAFRESAFYREGGVIAHLFWEELRTARSWVIPFFTHLRQTPLGQNLEPGTTEPISHELLWAAWQTFDRSRFPEYNPDAPGTDS